MYNPAIASVAQQFTIRGSVISVIPPIAELREREIFTTALCPAATYVRSPADHTLFLQYRESTYRLAIPTILSLSPAGYIITVAVVYSKILQTYWMHCSRMSLVQAPCYAVPKTMIITVATVGSHSLTPYIPACLIQHSHRYGGQVHQMQITDSIVARTDEVVFCNAGSI